MHSDILIIGGGMVGACAALALADLGLSVQIIEKDEPQPVWADSTMGLRVSALNLASEALLTQVGVWSAIQAVRHCVYRRLAVWEGEQAPVTFNANEIQQTHLGHIIENDVVQYALWQQCLSHPRVTCVLSQTLSDLQQNAEQISLCCDDRRFSATWLLACDGGQSPIRQLAGIGVTGWQYQQQALVVAIDTHTESQDITWQQMSPTGPKAFLPLAHGKASLVWYHHADEVKRLRSLPKTQLKTVIQHAFPTELVDFEIEQISSFPLTRQHAHTYVKGRVLLLGDSAHLINPLAGQGVNLGFKDVAALQTLLAKAIKEGADWRQSDVLKHYELSRQRENLLMMSAMDGIYATFSNANPLLKCARQAGLNLVNQLPMLKKLATKYACGI